MSYWRYNGNNSTIEEVKVNSDIVMPKGTPGALNSVGEQPNTEKRKIKQKKLKARPEDVELMREWNHENQL